MKKQTVRFVTLVAILSWLMTGMAFAQGMMDTPPPFDEEGEELGEEEAEAVDEEEAAEADQLVTEAAEDSVLNKRKVNLPLAKKAKVVQKKLFPKDFKHELNVFVGLNPSDSFVVSLVEGLRYNFHINEMFGVQAVFGYLQNFNRDSTNMLTDSIDKGGLNIDSEFIKNAEVNWFAGADFVFYPIYGKFALLSDVIAHYDAGIYVGCAAMAMENGEYGPAPDIGLVSNIYFFKWLSLRLDFMYYALITDDKRTKFEGSTGNDITSSAAQSGKERGGTLLRNNYFITLGVSFHLPVD